MEDRKHFSGYFKTAIAAWVVLLLAVVSQAEAQTIYEVWTPAIDNQSEYGVFGSCFFRKKLSLVEPEEAEIYLAAKDDFELYFNDQPVGNGQSLGKPVKFDVSSMLRPGVNVIAIRVDHQSSPTAGLAVKFRVREKNETRWRSLTTDGSWKSEIGAGPNWFATGFDDSGWVESNKLASVSFNPEMITAGTAGAFNPKAVSAAVVRAQSNQPGTLATAAANMRSGNQDIKVATDNSATAVEAARDKQDSETTSKDRFTIDPEFQVQQVMLDSETGSLIAMAFNEFGQLILSKEGGPLYLADVTKEPGDSQRVRPLCNEMNSCQGILPLNGRIYVTGQGPSGLGLYRLMDTNRDGMFEVEKMLIPFTGKLGEHGPHGIELGPDGMIYVVVGNFSKSDKVAAKTSPYLHTYEGDLVPRLEDPGGHAVGIKVPGGTVIRTTLDGDFVETVSGGLRNVYDLAFDQYGELFLHDSDMETNIGMAWYQPTRIYHVPHGAELGWRSGWANFPYYFADVTPPIVETGRGSPSGAVAYQHFHFPARFHNSLFFADWSEGRILSMRPQPKGAGYEAEVDVFVSGRPMNVTDLDVGMDGTLFFCTGGRGTSGGVYRITWTGSVPAELYKYNNDFERVIRMPQPRSAWGRQATALLKAELAEDWESTLSGISTDVRNDIDYRLRAVELLVLYGPFPGDELIATLARDEDYRMRARIASLCGAKVHKPLNDNLSNLISDGNPLVRRKAAESCLRLNSHPPVGRILALLGSNDKTEAAVARRLLERAPANSFRDSVLQSEESGVFINGAITLLTAYPSLENSYLVLARITHFMDGFMTDIQFTDILRVAQLALVRGTVDPSEIPGFGERMVNEFPAGSGIVNKQLSMIMAFMKTGNVDDRIENYFKTSDNSDADKLFVAMQLQTIGSQLSDTCRYAVVDYLEQAIQLREGSTYRTYIGNAIRDLAGNFTQPEQIDAVIKNGARWPNAMLQSFFNLQGPLTRQQVEWVIAADRDMPDGSDAMTRRIRMGCIAVLAESGEESAHEYLRQIWKARPNYRNEISLGLAQEPADSNWPYLVTSIPILDDTIGMEVVNALLEVNRRPKQAKQYRELIELGYRLRDKGALAVSNVMQHWTNTESDAPQAPTGSWREAMDHWTQWYGNRWPDELPVNVESLPKVGNYTAEQVLAHLEEFQHQGIAGTGRFVFQKANCHACHRLGNDGATFGPDLTNLSSRFSRREILESIIHPSLVVSDQYRSKKILTVDGDQLFGMLTRDSSGAFLLLDLEGRSTRITEDEIEEMADSDLSSMPERLLDTLSLDEILHLFSYLHETREPTAQAQDSLDPSSVR